MRHRLRLRLIEPGGAVDRFEQFWRRVRRLGGSQEQKAVRVQRIVEDAAHLCLKLAFQIDQQVAAGDQVDPDEGRVLQRAVAGEQHDVAHLLADAVVLAFPGEVPLQPPRKRRPRWRADNGPPGSCQRPFVEVGREDLDGGKTFRLSASSSSRMARL